jgi:hypothetical protein
MDQAQLIQQDSHMVNVLFGWLVAGADLLWEKNTAGCQVAGGWCWIDVRKSIAGWLRKDCFSYSL